MFGQERIAQGFLYLALVGGLALTGLGLADDAGGKLANHLVLRGDYAFTQLDVCVGTPLGGAPPTFDPDTLQLVGDAAISTLQSIGISSFDGNGGWTATYTVTTIFHGQLAPGDFPVFAPATGTCEGPYSLHPDRTFEILASCQNDDPPFLGSAPRNIRGYIGRDRRTLVLADTDPVIEELFIPGVGVIAERVCTAVATDVQVWKLQ